MTDDKTLDKIKKMLVLGKDSDSAESATALKMAAKLMKKHNLSQTDITLSDINEVRVKSKFSVSKPKSHEVAVYRIVEKAFGVRMYFVPAQSWEQDNWGRYTMVGPTDQLAIAEYTVQVLIRNMVKARIDFLKTVPSMLSRSERSAEGDTFARHWANAIARMVHEFANPDDVDRAMKDMVEAETGGHRSRSGAKRGSTREIDSNHTAV